jgi:hypothetical protein
MSQQDEPGGSAAPEERDEGRSAQPAPGGDTPFGAALEQWRALTERMLSFAAAAPGAPAVGGGGVPATGAVPPPEWLTMLQVASAQVAAPLAQLESVLADIRSRREQVRALQTSLAAFEQQLEALERSLTPLLEWTRTWRRLQESTMGWARSADPAGPA